MNDNSVYMENSLDFKEFINENQKTQKIRFNDVLLYNNNLRIFKLKMIKKKNNNNLCNQSSPN